jgi:hypothetical protein
MKRLPYLDSGFLYFSKKVLFKSKKDCFGGGFLLDVNILIVEVGLLSRSCMYGL